MNGKDMKGNPIAETSSQGHDFFTVDSIVGRGNIMDIAPKMKILLPASSLYPEGSPFRKEITVRGMVNIDHKYFAMTVFDNLYIAIKDLLQRCVTDIDGNPIDPSGLFVGDADYVLWTIWTLTYGDRAVIDMECPFCGKRIKSKPFSVSELVFKTPEDLGLISVPVKVPLPVTSCEVELSPLTISDMIELVGGRIFDVLNAVYSELGGKEKVSHVPMKESPLMRTLREATGISKQDVETAYDQILLSIALSVRGIAGKPVLRGPAGLKEVLKFLLLIPTTDFVAIRDVIDRMFGFGYSADDNKIKCNHCGRDVIIPPGVIYGDLLFPSAKGTI